MRASWAFCDRCGCSVDVELIDDESHHYDALGTFYCADCWTVLEDVGTDAAGEEGGAERPAGRARYVTTGLLPPEY